MIRETMSGFFQSSPRFFVNTVNWGATAAEAEALPDALGCVMTINQNLSAEKVYKKISVLK
jgi:hypothetical protein